MKKLLIFILPLLFVSPVFAQTVPATPDSSLVTPATNLGLDFTDEFHPITNLVGPGGFSGILSGAYQAYFTVIKDSELLSNDVTVCISAEVTTTASAGNNNWLALGRSSDNSTVYQYKNQGLNGTGKHVICMRKIGPTVETYLNNVLQPSETMTLVPNQSIAGVTILRQGQNQFTSLLYDFHYYKRALSDPELTQLFNYYQIPPGPQCGNLHQTSHPILNPPEPLQYTEGSTTDSTGLCDNSNPSTVTFGTAWDRSCTDGQTTVQCLAFEETDQLELLYGEVCPGSIENLDDTCICEDGTLVFPGGTCIDRNASVFGSGGFLDLLSGGIFGGLGVSGTGSITEVVSSNFENVFSLLDFSYTPNSSIDIGVPWVTANGTFSTQTQSVNLFSVGSSTYTKVDTGTHIEIMTPTGNKAMFKKTPIRNFLNYFVPVLAGLVYVIGLLLMIYLVMIMPIKRLYEHGKDYASIFFLSSEQGTDSILTLPFKIVKMTTLFAITGSLILIFFQFFVPFYEGFKTIYGSLIEYILTYMLFFDGVSLSFVTTIISTGFVTFLVAFIAYYVSTLFAKLT